jgi:hypothetical protein
MRKDTTDRYHAQPDEAFHAAKPAPLPADFSFNDSEPPPEADFTGTGGRFREGHDPRRHTFTAEECSAGFWAGLASYVEQGGEARNFLKRKLAGSPSFPFSTTRRLP